MRGAPIITDLVGSKGPPQEVHNAGCNKDKKDAKQAGIGGAVGQDG